MKFLSRRHRKTIKIIWSTFCVRSRFIDVALRFRRSRLGSPQVAILTYHRVLPSKQVSSVFSSPHIITTKEDFEAQIRYLTRHYRILSLDEFAALRHNPKPIPLKSAIITFDDGWQDNYLHALPILNKYKVPATIYLATLFIEKNYTFRQERLRFLIHTLWDNETARKKVIDSILDRWADDKFQYNFSEAPNEIAEFISSKLKEGNRETGEKMIEALNECAGNPVFPMKNHEFLTWNQIREMAQHQISFGSHTHSHRLLSDLSVNEMQREISGSKKEIEMELGQVISTLAYPNGTYGPEIFGLLKASGYSLALTTTPGLNSFNTHPYELRRINIQSQRFSDGKNRFSKALFAARLAFVL